MDKHPIQGGEEILLLALCYEKKKTGINFSKMGHLITTCRVKCLVSYKKCFVTCYSDNFFVSFFSFFQTQSSWYRLNFCGRW